MKKILLALSFLSVSIMSAQSLGIYSGDTLVIDKAETAVDVISHIRIKNISNKDVDVKVKRLDRNYNNLTDSNAICWDICFQTDVSLSPTTITLQPGEISGSGLFSGHVYPDGDSVPYTGPITYVFFNESNPQDSVAFTVRYAISDTVNSKLNFEVNFPSVSLLEKKVNEVKVYPNPAKDRLSASYNLLGGHSYNFELISLVGKTVFRKELAGTKGELNLDLTKLSRGIYFYVLRSDGEALITRKLVVE